MVASRGALAAGRRGSRPAPHAPRATRAPRPRPAPRPPTRQAPAAAKKSGKAVKTTKWSIDTGAVAKDQVIDPAAFEKYLLEHIKLENKKGALGEKVAVAHEGATVTVSVKDDARVSKRYVKCALARRARRGREAVGRRWRLMEAASTMRARRRALGASLTPSSPLPSATPSSTADLTKKYLRKEQVRKRARPRSARVLRAFSPPPPSPSSPQVRNYIRVIANGKSGYLLKYFKTADDAADE